MQHGRIILILIGIPFLILIGSIVMLIVNSNTVYTPDYEIIYIEEMPCLVIDSGYGITCDWSEWNGE